MARLTGSLNIEGSIEASSLTGSFNWNSLENVPDGIMSSSDGVVPDGTVSSSAQVVAALPAGTVSGSAQVQSSLPSGLFSSSIQVDAASITNFDTEVENALNNNSVDFGTGAITAASITGSLDYDQLENVPDGIMSSSTGFVENEDTASFVTNSQTSSMSVASASVADTASFVTGSAVDGEVYRAERARRIEVGSYGSYSSLTDIPFITGDYGSNIKRISSDGALQWHAGTEHLTVPGVNATSLTGSLNWSDLEDIPDGIMSSSNGIVPDGTVSSSAQIVAGLPEGTISGSDQVDLTGLEADDLYFNGGTIAQAFGATSLGNAYSESRGNVAVGLCAFGDLSSYADLDQNVAIGLTAGQCVDGDSVNNVFVGFGAGGCNNNCHNGNIAVGSFAHRCGGGQSNVSIGNTAGEDTTGNFNIAIGSTAMREPVTGCGNVVIGGIAGRCVTGSSGYNIFIGYNAGSSNFYQTSDFTDFQSGSYLAINPTLGTEPSIHGRFGAYSSIGDYLQFNAPTSASSFEAASLTGSLNWSDLEDVPSGLVSSSLTVPDGTISSSAQINDIQIHNRNGNDDEHAVLLSYVNDPLNNTVTSKVAFDTNPGGTIGLRYNPDSGRLSLGSLINSGSIQAYGLISGDELTSARAINGKFLNLQAKAIDGDLPESGQDHYITLSATGSKNNYQIKNGSGTQYDPMWSYRAGGYGANWTRVLTEQNVASGSATLTRMWVNGLVTGSTAEFESLTGSLSWNDLENIPSDIMSSSAQVGYYDVQDIPVSASNPATPVLHITNGSTDRRLVAIGNNVLTNAISASNLPFGSVVIGDKAGAGLNAGILGSDNVVIGRETMENDGNQIDGCLNLGVVIGAYAGFNSSGTENTTIGAQSFTSGSGHSNTIMGTWSANGYGFTGGQNTIIGHQAGGSSAAGVGIKGDSCKNTIVGASATVRQGSCNVLIGFGAGSDTDFSNKLKIENGGSSPLIEGDFSTNHVKINDVLELNQSDPLPTGGVGQLAVSASNLYFHNGTSWSQIN